MTIPEFLRNCKETKATLKSMNNKEREWMFQVYAEHHKGSRVEIYEFLRKIV